MNQTPAVESHHIACITMPPSIYVWFFFIPHIDLHSRECLIQNKYLFVRTSFATGGKTRYIPSPGSPFPLLKKSWSLGYNPHCRYWLNCLTQKRVKSGCNERIFYRGFYHRLWKV